MKNLVLGTSLEVLIDHRGKTPRKLATDFVESGVPVASAILVKEGRLDLTDARYVDYATFRRWMTIQTKVGDVLLTSEAPLGRVAHISTDAPMVLGQRLFGLRGRHGVLDSGYLYYALQTDQVQSDLIGRSTGTTVSGIRQSALRCVVIPAPPFPQQQRIARLLGALDDKMAANETALRTAAQLARLHFECAVKSGYRRRIDEVASMIKRGVTPKYVDSGGLTVLNQKCVRDQWVDLRPARTMEPQRAREDRMLIRDDVLVNSTGFGTLGRAARWVHRDIATVDTHITIVRFYEPLVDPVCAGSAVLELEEKIESLAQGSTGQTELSRDLLGGLEIRLPRPDAQPDLGRKLRGFDDLAITLRVECSRLAATRDQLLPLLMSGKVHVNAAEKCVEEVV